MGIQNYLIENGFIAYRKVYENKNFIYKLNDKSDFSTMVGGGLDIRYVKDNVEITYGLNELGIPPTILSPLPNIKGGVNISEQNRTMRALNKYSSEDFFKAMFDKSIILEID